MYLVSANKLKFLKKFCLEQQVKLITKVKIFKRGMATNEERTFRDFKSNCDCKAKVRYCLKKLNIIMKNDKNMPKASSLIK